MSKNRIVLFGVLGVVVGLVLGVFGRDFIVASEKQEFEAQKAQLETEVADLKAKEEGKEKVFEKLKKDSEVRWHRDKYKQVLNNYDVYYKNIAKLIKEKEQKIAELEQILAIMGN